MANLKPKRADWMSKIVEFRSEGYMRTENPDLRVERAELGPEMADWIPERVDLTPERPDGGTNGQKNE